MSTETLNQKLDALDGKTVDYSDPSTYTALLYGDGVAGDETAGGADLTQKGDTDATQGAATQQQTTAPAAAPAAAAAAPAGEESSATPAAAETQAGNEARIDGIATRDGKHVIPYAILENTRSALRQTTQELEELRQQLEEAKRPTSGTGSEQDNLAQRAQSDPGSLSEQELDELATDFPAIAKLATAFRDSQARLAALEASNKAPAPAAAAPTQQAAAPAPTVEDEDAAFDAAIAANPLVARWMGERGREWQAAVQIDKVLQQDPTTAGLSYTERFAKVQRMVAAQFGIELPPAASQQQTTTQAPAPKTAAPAAPAQAPVAAPALPTLTDFGGSAVVTGADPLAGMTHGQMVDRAMDMSEAQLRALAGIPY